MGLITPAELVRLRQERSDVVVADLRQDPADHQPKVPGSRWVGLHAGFAMARPDRGLHYDLPTPAELAAAMGEIGATPSSAVVFLDDMGNRWATRAYWVCRYYRHPGPLYVLDGGVGAWAASGLASSDGFESAGAAAYPPPAQTDESIRATADQVRALIGSSDAVLCDVRTYQEHVGQVVMAPRGGRVPGSVHVPWERALAGDGTFLPAARLAEVLGPQLSSGKDLIPYCQGGIRASLTWFCLHELLGRPARLYAGSWEEWARARELPVESGSVAS